MGKLTLLLVGAAILGGSLLTYSTREFAGGTEKTYRAGQADLISRQIAESGHSVVLSAIVDDSGFSAPASTTQAYEGGVYRVEYDPASTANRATFTVAADYAGATHVIKSTYEWDPMSYPGPIWLDVPYASATVDPGAKVSGGSDGLQVQFDRRKHDEFGLNSIVPLATMETSMTSEFASKNAKFDAGRAANTWPAMLEDLNVDNAEGLYQAALAEAPETTIAGPLAVTNNRNNIGDVDEVTHVTGDLEVASGGRFSGEGALVIDGLFTVESGGRFEWTGIVIVKSQEQFTPIRLEGRVDIEGGLVIVQEAFPPGGHLDMTVWRDKTGSLSSSNLRGEAVKAPWGASEPWVQHKHRFDVDLGTKRVALLDGGSAVAAMEPWTLFENTISSLGSQDVYLEVVNPGQHGYSVYDLKLKSDTDAYAGSVRNGWGDFATDTNPHVTKTFAANDLEDLVIDVRSLQGLKDRFDGQGGCSAAVQWPRCLSYEWNRGGVMRLRLRKASGAIVYDSGFYWHMQSVEWTEYQERVAQWQAQIQSGALFGTRLELGKDVDIEYKLDPVMDLVERLNFDGHETVHVGSETSHRTRDQNMALAQSSVPGKYTLCHSPGASYQTKEIALEDLEGHLRHGDYLGTCGTTTGKGSGSGGTPPPGPPPQIAPSCVGLPVQVSICNKPGGGQGWRDRTVGCTSVANHLGHGCRIGTCAANGL